jgi:hypothetical protein
LYVSAVTLIDQKESFSGESEEQPGLADGCQRDAKVADGPRLWDPGDTGNWP